MYENVWNDNDYLSEFKVEYDVKKGLNCFYFKGCINNDSVTKEDIGVAVFSQQNSDEPSIIDIISGKMLIIDNTLIDDLEKNVKLGGISMMNQKEKKIYLIITNILLVYRKLSYIQVFLLQLLLVYILNGGLERVSY